MVFGLVVIVDITMDFAPSVMEGTIRYVNETGIGGAYTKIQDAINASSDGDTIYVYNGTYYENVIVNKTLALMGEDKNTTIVNGGWADDPIYVSSDWVNISGFTVTHSGIYWYDAGIDLESVENCRITGNIAIENARGFRLYYSNRSTLSGNIAIDNWVCGFFITHSNNFDAQVYHPLKISKISYQ